MLNGGDNIARIFCGFDGFIEEIDLLLWLLGVFDQLIEDSPDFVHITSFPVDGSQPMQRLPEMLWFDEFRVVGDITKGLHLSVDRIIL